MNKDSGAPYVRREVRSLGPDDKTLLHYADAVGAMQNKPEQEETSWLYQAAIHGTYAQPELPDWNRCTHNTWFFISWHRMFVYYFEQIVRSVVEELHGAQAAGEWALPYWNYCRGEKYATLPDAFLEKGRKVMVDGKEEEVPNPLYVAERDPVVNAGGELDKDAIKAQEALNSRVFIGKAGFGGKPEKVKQFGERSSRGLLEQSPHGPVHNQVGGPLGWMADVQIAAKDPIFWLHHCNIDRLWDEWISRGEGRENPTESDWLDQSFPFYDALGNRVSMTCREVVDTVGLGYEYDSVDGVPDGPAPTPGPRGGIPAMSEDLPSGPKIVGASERRVTLTGRPAAVSVEIDERAREEVREASTESDPRNLYLNVEDIEGEVNPAVDYGIYLNLPEGADEETRSAHHVGNVSFFGIDLAREPLKDEPAHNLLVSVEVGTALRALGGGEQFDGSEIEVTFLPLLPKPPAGREEEFRPLLEARMENPPVGIGRISLGIDA